MVHHWIMGVKKEKEVVMLGLNMEEVEMAVAVAVEMTTTVAVEVVVTPVKGAKVDCLLDSSAVPASVVSVGILSRPIKEIDSLWAVEVVPLTWAMVMGLGMVIMLEMAGEL